MKKVLFIILTIFISILFMGFENQNDLSKKGTTETFNKNNQIVPPAGAIASKLKLLSSDWSYDDYFTYITGIVENTSDKKATLVCIEFSLFDKDEIKLGTANSCVDSLGAGEKWKFKAMVTKEDAKYYKFEKITGF